MTISTSPASAAAAGGARSFTRRANGCDEHRAFQAGCVDCVENARAYQQMRSRAVAYGCWQPSLVDAEPVAELLRQLVATGWTFTYLAERLDRRIMTVTAIAHGERERVTDELAIAVSDLYDELLTYPAPTGRAATYARRTAARHGWQPIVDEPWRSMVDVDAEVVRRAVREEDPGRELGVAERRAAIDHAVHVSRRNHVDAARVLKVSVRTIIRHESRRRETSAAG